ncbi:MAG: MarR family transcriptional regulator, partial [Desulfosarcina sp.]|nr:MarR family transcriptional regulator [Desulfobacterales bacterium]
MNDKFTKPNKDIPNCQVVQFQELMARLFQCCQERMQYQSERFALPDAELRCLQLFANERYLTPKSIAHKMDVVKSRVTRIIDGMVRRELIQRIKDPADSRITLLRLTPRGQVKLDEIKLFMDSIHLEVLSQIAPGQRKAILTNLEVLKASMEAVNEFMV